MNVDAAQVNYEALCCDYSLHTDITDRQTDRPE